MSISISQETGLAGYGITDDLRPVDMSHHQYMRDKPKKPKVLVAALQLSISRATRDTGPGACMSARDAVCIRIMK